MSQESAVDFPGRHRIHVALTCSNLSRSIEFYTLLFGELPSKERPRYAKFEPKDPSVNLALNEADSVEPIPRSSSHFGVQVKSVAAVHAAHERFQAAGFDTLVEEATTCCYAVQDKVWVIDPDGNRWEVFVVLNADAVDELYQSAGCCGPQSAEVHEISSLSGTRCENN